MKNTKLLSSLECVSYKQFPHKLGWDHFFLNLHPVSEDFMSHRAPKSLPDRDLFDESRVLTFDINNATR